MEEDIGSFIRFGYCLATPEYFVMGKGVRKGAKLEHIIEPTYVFPKDEQDCWFVYAFTGAAKDFLAFLPYELTWLAWQRRDSALRYWTLTHFRKTCAVLTPYVASTYEM